MPYKYHPRDPDVISMGNQLNELNNDYVLVTGSPCGPNGFSIKLKSCNEYWRTELSEQDVLKIIRELKRDSHINRLLCLEGIYD